MKKKSMDWYKQQQRFSVRKYHFGAASVLLGTALVFGGAQASADEVTAYPQRRTFFVGSCSSNYSRLIQHIGCHRGF